MYKNRKVRRTTLWDKTVAGAINFLKTGKIKSTTILFQIGSNDLDHMSEDEVMKEIEQMVKVTREMYPESNVVFTEILPRFYRDMNMLTQYNQKRRLFNNLLKDYCNDLVLAIVNFGDYFDIDSFYDGIHLNQKGINVYVCQVKRDLNPIMGMDIPPKQSQSSSSSNTQSHVVDRKHRPDLSRNAYVQEREMVYNSGFDKNTSVSLGPIIGIFSARIGFHKLQIKKSYNSMKSIYGFMSDGSRYNDKYMYDRHNVNKDKENMLGVLRQMLGNM